MKKIALVSGALAVLLFFSLSFASSQKSAFLLDARADTGLVIVATLFPQYDFARHIVGERASVSLLLPPGTESHTFDPRPADIMRIEAADLFLYTGRNMEPWAARIADSVAAGGPLIVDTSRGIELMRALGAHVADEEHDHDHDDGQPHDHAGFDPHFWLNPLHAIRMVETIEAAVVSRDPANRAYYRTNAQELIDSLAALDAETTRVVRDGSRDTLVFGGRFAYRYFTERYGLHYVTAYRSCSTESEPSVRDVMDVIAYVRANRIPCVYHEEFVDPKVARAISEASGAELRMFRTAHNVTRDELDGGVSFLDIMRRNLENVKYGLD